MGGAGAIGAFAYGVAAIGLEPVQLITGPGNVYVAAAKRFVRSFVGIDAEAGPTEIMVIADGEADAVPGGQRLDQPGGARRVGRRAAGHRLGSAGGCRHSGTRPPRAPGGASRTGRRGAGRPAVRHRARRRHDHGGGVQQRVRARAPGDPDIRSRHRARGRRQRRCHLRRRELPGEPGRLHGRFQPRAADRRPGAIRAGTWRLHVPAPAAGRAIHAGCVAARPSPRIVALAAAEDLPAHGAAVTARFRR